MKTLILEENQAVGRCYAAARMMAGMDQGKLAEKAGVSASTISNLERGSDIKDETITKIRKALWKSGVKVSIDLPFGTMILAATVLKNEEEGT